MFTYLLIAIITVPTVISLVFNLFIFGHIRKLSKRVRRQSASAQVNANNRLPFSRHDMHFLRQMIFVSCIFVVGSYPFYRCALSKYFRLPVPNWQWICALSVYQLCWFAGLFNLFKNHHEVRRFLREKFGCCYRIV